MARLTSGSLYAMSGLRKAESGEEVFGHVRLEHPGERGGRSDLVVIAGQPVHGDGLRRVPVDRPVLRDAGGGVLRRLGRLVDSG